MIKKILCSVLAVFIIVLFPLCSFAAGIPESVLNAAASVLCVEVETEEYLGGGSGFVICNEDGATYIATNAHVVEDAEKIYVWLNDKERSEAKISVKNQDCDLAILKLDEKTDLTPLPLNESAARGEAVYAIGFPLAADILSQEFVHTNEEATITDGIISAVKESAVVENGPLVDFYQITAAVSPGNSGGPLLNEKGEVISINSFTVTESISGSICVNRLITLMNKIGISPVQASAEQEEPAAPKPSLPAYAIALIAAAGVLAAAGAVIAIVLLRKKKGSSEALFEYINRNGPLTADRITALMMPAARSLRDMHADGRAFLCIDPSSIRITKTGSRIVPVKNASLNIAYAAPEQLRGGRCGVFTDIYSFCAVINSAAEYSSGIIRDPGLSELCAAVRPGLSQDPLKRFASMQEVIYALSTFNTLDYSAAYVSKPASASRAAASRRHLEHNTPSSAKPSGRLLTAVLIPFGALFILTLYVLTNLLLSSIFTGAGNNRAAYIFMKNIPASQLIYPDNAEYAEARFNFDSGKFKEAASGFTKLGSYRDSQSMANAANYEYAAKLIEEYNFDEAIDIYEQLGSYKDSAEKIPEAVYEKACYTVVKKGDRKKGWDILTESGLFTDSQINDLVCKIGLRFTDYDRYDLADRYYSELTKTNIISFENQRLVIKNIKEYRKQLNFRWAKYLFENKEYYDAVIKMSEADGYPDAEKRLEEMEQALYDAAISEYDAGKYTQAIKSFSLLKSYKRADDYIVMCIAHLDY